jgi:hypothetical protein
MLRIRMYKPNTSENSCKTLELPPILSSTVLFRSPEMLIANFEKAIHSAVLFV